MKILITGANGLIGGAAVEYFDAAGYEVHGTDNNMRAKFFGAKADTSWNRHRIFHKCKNYHPNDIDITSDEVWCLFHRGKGPYTEFHYDAVIHCAAQPSHEFANREPQTDYKVNVLGTQNLLEAVRQYNREAVFIFMSTNKVYDDAVNAKKYTEFDMRYDDPQWQGFDETTPVGASSTFGSHKLEADEMVQRYARDYGLKTMVLRGGCLTGLGHSGVPQHGFLNYLMRCAVTDASYQIIGYSGKQVRDNIHSFDVITAFDEMIKNPRPGEVYNLGGGRENSTSIHEAVSKAEKILGKKMKLEYQSEPRKDDHICYITDMTKFKRDFPNWKITKSLNYIFAELANHLYWGTRSEHEETMNYPELNKDSVVWDIGGYRGQWSHEIYKQCEPSIYIFEPVKEFADACRYRFRAIPKIRIFDFGFSGKDTEIEIAKQGVNTSTIRGGENQTALNIDPVWGNATQEKVKLVDIVGQLENHPDIDLVSLNCEGGEYDILDRLIDAGLICKFKNVQVQFHDFHPDAKMRRNKIRQRLEKTHLLRFDYPFVWESWRLNEHR